MRTVGLLFLFCLTGPAAAAGMYKCVDAQGKIEYRELPKADLQCTSIGTSKPSGESGAAELQRLRERLEQSEATKGDQQAATDAEDVRSKNCEAARRNQEILQGDTDVIRTDAQGNKSVLSADERQAALEQARKDINYYCN